MNAVVLGRNSHVARIHEHLVVSMDSVIIRSHVDGAAVHIDILFGRKSLAGRSNLDGRGFGGIADADKVFCLDAVIAGLDGDGAARDFDDAFTFDDVLAFAIDFFAFVAFKAVALLGGKVQDSARNLEAALALDGVFFGFDGDVAVLDFKVVAALDAVSEFALDGQGACALDVQVVSGVDGCFSGVLCAVDLGEQMIAIAIFDYVGGALDQVNHRLVGVLHENRSVRTFQSGVVEVDSGVTFFFGGRSIYDYLEI